MVLLKYCNPTFDRYKCSEDKDYIPTYEEVVHDSEGDLSEDEKILEKQMEFEHKYNFRFEEPDPEFVSEIILHSNLSTYLLTV